jgi:hypothetical protein
MEHSHSVKPGIKAYWPLILVLMFVAGAALHLGWVRGEYNLFMTEIDPSFSLSNLMLDFMGFFFMAFAFFKLLDVKAFADAYRSYDIPTKLWPTWGYLYPFVELSLGLLLLHRIELFWTNLAIVIILGASIVGVIQSVMQKRQIKCACLGTGFNLPMTQVTIIEDGAMILMAILMLLI